MNARVAKEELAILLPNTMSHYFHNDHDYAPQPESEIERPGLFARIGAMLSWIAELPKRRAVLDELGMLSDHELADIGLSRVDLPRVFDPAFAADREAQRAGSHFVEGRTAAA
jgi:uncharacterized protein YjiS (DUF1127 family)